MTKASEKIAYRWTKGLPHLAKKYGFGRTSAHLCLRCCRVNRRTPLSQIAAEVVASALRVSK